MSWQNELALIVRHLINDVDESTYDNARIEQTIVIAAQLAQFEVDFEKDYVTDVDGCSISPDPTATTRDDAFINLISLKASCIITAAEAKNKQDLALKIKDGPSSIDATEVAKGYQKLHEQLCKAYQASVMQYQIGNSRSGVAVTGPIVTQNANVRQGNF
jgi:hypothetical protein